MSAKKLTANYYYHEDANELEIFQVMQKNRTIKN